MKRGVDLQQGEDYDDWWYRPDGSDIGISDREFCAEARRLVSINRYRATLLKHAKSCERCKAQLVAERLMR